MWKFRYIMPPETKLNGSCYNTQPKCDLVPNLLFRRDSHKALLQVDLSPYHKMLGLFGSLGAFNSHSYLQDPSLSH